MTEGELDLLATIYRLGDLIRAKNWLEAEACWTWLLNAYAPMQQLQPHVEAVLRNEADMVRAAEKLSSKIH